MRFNSERNNVAIASETSSNGPVLMFHHQSRFHHKIIDIFVYLSFLTAVNAACDGNHCCYNYDCAYGKTCSGGGGGISECKCEEEWPFPRFGTGRCIDVPNQNICNEDRCCNTDDCPNDSYCQYLHTPCTYKLDDSNNYCEWHDNCISNYCRNMDNDEYRCGSSCGQAEYAYGCVRDLDCIGDLICVDHQYGCGSCANPPVSSPVREPYVYVPTTYNSPVSSPVREPYVYVPTTYNYPDSEPDSDSTGVVIGVICGVCLFALIGIYIFCRWKKKKSGIKSPKKEQKRKKNEDNEEEDDREEGMDVEKIGGQLIEEIQQKGEELLMNGGQFCKIGEEFLENPKDSVGGIVASTKEAVGEIKDGAVSYYKDTEEAVGDTTEAVVENPGEVAEGALDAAGEAGGAAVGAAGDAVTGAAGMVTDAGGALISGVGSLF